MEDKYAGEKCYHKMILSIIYGYGVAGMANSLQCDTALISYFNLLFYYYMN